MFFLEIKKNLILKQKIKKYFNNWLYSKVGTTKSIHNLINFLSIIRDLNLKLIIVGKYLKKYLT